MPMNNTTKGTTTPKVVVVGSGFGGIETIKALSGIACEIVLVTKRPLFEYYPALYKLVTGALPIEVSVPIQKIFFNTPITIIEGTYISLDKERQVIGIETAGGGKEIAYDYLVLAMGSETNFFDIKGLPERSHSFKSVDAALRLKQHFCELFSKVQGEPKEKIVSLLHVLVVGGGPSGVELAGDLKSYLTRVATEFSVDPSFVTIDLIESNPRILPTLPASVSIKAEKRLRALGVNIFVNRTLAQQDIDEVLLKDMSIQSHTVVWTAGTRINSAFLSIPGVTLNERKRVVVTDTLALPDDAHVFVIGDGAATAYSGLAQTAIEHGIHVGKTIKRMIQGKTPTSYKASRPTFVVPIGNNWAILNYKSFVMTGYIPWILRSAIDFRYFTHIVPIRYVFEVFQKGKKYRAVKGGCALDATIN